MKTITFKSIPENFRKEYLGIKPCTLRCFPEKGDIREELLRDYINGKLSILLIEILCDSTKESFIRRVTDVTPWDGYYIISWSKNDHNP